MDPEKQLSAVSRRRKAEEPLREARYAEDSRARLAKIVRKKMTTANIGALSAVEANLGRLWGHGKPESECTAAELAARAAWAACRSAILDNGNKQLRAVEQELAEYTVHWDRHRAEFRPGV